jgi:hypothetical protein
VRLLFWRDDVDVNTPTTELRRRFEQLCLLRSLYARRGVDDASSVMTLAQVVDHVRAVLAEDRGHAEPEMAHPDR